LILKYFLAWLPMVLIAIINGAARDFLYGKKMTEIRAHQVSTVLGATLLGVYIWAVILYLRPGSAGQAMGTGLLWLILTVAFEFIFGRFVAGHSWARLFGDYNIFAGRLWAPLLIWITLAPYLFYRLTDSLR
jgi:hypothetical protein